MCPVIGEDIAAALRRLGPSARGTAALAIAPVWQDWFLAPKGGRRLDSASHAAGIWLVDARGGLRGRWSAGAPVDPGDLAHDLAALR